MKKLEDKNVVITGATGGIGLATSTLFLQEGARVVLIDKNQDELKKAEQSLPSKNAKFFQILPNPLLTEDQLRLLKYDNISSTMLRKF